MTPLARSASITYLKPARGPITANAALGERPDEVRSRLQGEGRTDFPVNVALVDGSGVTVAEVTVSWNVRMNTG